MNAKSFTLRIAALVITGAASIVNARAAELTGRVPMDFTVTGKGAAAGTYRIVEHLPGVVLVKDDNGRNVAIASMPVQTSGNPARSAMQFHRRNGSFELTGYCAQGRGCWAAVASRPRGEKVEISLVTSR